MTRIGNTSAFKPTLMGYGNPHWQSTPCQDEVDTCEPEVVVEIGLSCLARRRLGYWEQPMARKHVPGPSTLHKTITLTSIHSQLPISPSTSSPSTTMRALDPQIYPHIFDMVIEHADRSALFALRRASRSLRDRCDELLVRHFALSPDFDERPRHPAFMGLRLYDALAAVRSDSSSAGGSKLRSRGDTSDGRSPSSSDGVRRQPPRAAKRSAGTDDGAASNTSQSPPPSATTPTSHRGRDPNRSLDPSPAAKLEAGRAVRAHSLLRHIRFLDLGIERDFTLAWLKYGPGSGLPALSIDSLRLVRFTSPESPDMLAQVHLHQGLPPPLGEPLPPLVSFRRLAPSAEGSMEHFRAEPVPTTRLTWTVMFDPFDPDLHHTEKGGQAWVQPFFYHDTTQEFVFVFVPDTSRHLRLRRGHRVARPRGQGSVNIHDVRNAMSVLGVLEDIVFHMAPELERKHTIVGVEGMAPEMLGLSHGASDEEKMGAVREGIREMLVRRRDNPRDRIVHEDLWPDELVERCVAAVEILTLEEYRGKVGEEQFALETRV